MSHIDITNLDKRQVLIALYNNARVQGSGWLQATDEPMTLDEAAALLKGQGGRFDYVHGRVLKVDLSADTFDTYLYDRDNGVQAAERAVQTVPSTST